MTHDTHTAAAAGAADTPAGAADTPAGAAPAAAATAAAGAPAAAPRARSANAAAAPGVNTPSKRRNRTRPKHVMQLLQWRLQQVQEECEVQQAKHSVLAGTEAVLAQMCEGLALMQLSARGRGGDSCQRLSTLLAQEGQLLQRLVEVGPPRLQGQHDHQQQHQLLPAASTLPTEPGAIAPANDPLFLFRRFTGPVQDDVSATTAADLSRKHRESVRGVGLQLELLSCGGATPEAASAAIERELVKLLRLLVACMVANKRPEVLQYLATNAETGEQQPQQAPAPAHAAQPTPAPAPSPAQQVVRHLGLTPLQEERIDHLLTAWTRVLKAQEAAMAQLRQRLGAAPAAEGCAAAPGSTAAPAAPHSRSGGNRHARGNSNSTSTNAPATAGSGPGSDGAVLARSAQLEEAAVLAKWLGAILHQMALVNTAFAICLIGELTWLQLGEVYLRMYPFPPLYYISACAIQANFEARQRAAEAEGAALQPPQPQQEQQQEAKEAGEGEAELSSP